MVSSCFTKQKFWSHNHAVLLAQRRLQLTLGFIFSYCSLQTAPPTTCLCLPGRRHCGGSRLPSASLMQLVWSNLNETKNETCSSVGCCLTLVQNEWNSALISCAIVGITGSCSAGPGKRVSGSISSSQVVSTG